MRSPNGKEIRAFDDLGKKPALLWGWLVGKVGPGRFNLSDLLERQTHAVHILTDRDEDLLRDPSWMVQRVTPLKQSSNESKRPKRKLQVKYNSLADSGKTQQIPILFQTKVNPYQEFQCCQAGFMVFWPRVVLNVDCQVHLSEGRKMLLLCFSATKFQARASSFQGALILLLFWEP